MWPLSGCGGVKYEDHYLHAYATPREVTRRFFSFTTSAARIRSSTVKRRTRSISRDRQDEEGSVGMLSIRQLRGDGLVTISFSYARMTQNRSPSAIRAT